VRIIRPLIQATLLALIDGILAPGAPAVEPPPAAAAPQAATAPQAHFNIHEYRVLGNTTLTNRDIERLLYPLLGDNKTITDVEAARTALEKTYHDRGFATVFVDIPEQEVADAIVRLRVTEGRLRQVHISGARYYSERKILAAVPSAAAGTVPNISELQSQLNAINVQTADRNVVPILKAGPIPGTVDLTMKVDDHGPFHGSIELDNQYTPNTEPLRANVLLSYANLFGELDNMSVQYQSSPQNRDQVQVIAANYAWGPIWGRLHPSLSFVDSNSNVPAVSTLGVLGKGQIYSARMGFALTDAPGMPQSITLGVDYKHFQENINFSDKPAFATPISYSNISLGYAGVWSSPTLVGSFSPTVNFGPRGAPNDPDAFAQKRFKGEPNYFYLRMDAALVAHLPKGFDVILHSVDQFAVEPLITNEQFSITGANAVRGYLEAEVLTDSGMLGSVQAQTPTWTVKNVPLANLFVFYDYGYAYVIDPLPGQETAYTLRSTGAGINLPGKSLGGVLTWAYPISTGPYTRAHDSRWLFLVRGAF
jgi:hemolysin activation/secretion protein